MQYWMWMRACRLTIEDMRISILSALLPLLLVMVEMMMKMVTADLRV